MLCSGPLVYSILFDHIYIKVSPLPFSSQISGVIKIMSAINPLCVSLCSCVLYVCLRSRVWRTFRKKLSTYVRKLMYIVPTPPPSSQHLIYISSRVANTDSLYTDPVPDPASQKCFGSGSGYGSFGSKCSILQRNIKTIFDTFVQKLSRTVKRLVFFQFKGVVQIPRRIQSGSRHSCT
jgi:hypothetical protein